jgi:hypothetical protein
MSTTFARATDEYAITEVDKTFPHCHRSNLKATLSHASIRRGPMGVPHQWTRGKYSTETKLA